MAARSTTDPSALRAIASGLPPIALGLWFLSIEFILVFFVLTSDSVGMWLIAGGAALMARGLWRKRHTLRLISRACVVIGIILLPTTVFQLGGWIWTALVAVEATGYALLAALLWITASQCRNAGYLRLARGWMVSVWTLIIAVSAGSILLSFVWFEFEEGEEPDWLYMASTTNGLIEIAVAVVVGILALFTCEAAKKPVRSIHREATAHGTCPECGYDLRGWNDGAICPECGMVVSARSDEPTIEKQAKPVNDKPWLPRE